MNELNFIWLEFINFDDIAENLEFEAKLMNKEKKK